MPKTDPFKIIRDLVVVIFALYLLYIIWQVFKEISGGSWGFEELVIGLLIANLGYSFYINTKLSRHLGMHEGYKKAKENNKPKK